MARRILDPKLMTKLAKKLGRQEQSIRVSVSQKAHKLGISSEAALISLAKQHGIGTSVYQRKLDATKQVEVRDALPTIFAANGPKERTPAKGKSGKRQAISGSKTQLKAAIEYLIKDPELYERCQDILRASKNFDRPINQATQVLEDRIRKKAQLAKKLTGEKLVGQAFNEELAKTVLQVASNDPDDQRGFTQILRGIVPAFRNITHHHITDNFSRRDAMRVCGFFDVLLRVVDGSKKVK
jgi:uncharacterized protein (TIGR02391 family)